MHTFFSIWIALIHLSLSQRRTVHAESGFAFISNPSFVSSFLTLLKFHSAISLKSSPSIPLSSDTLMGNPSGSVLPPDAVEKMGIQIEQLQAQIDMLQKELEQPLTFSKKEVLAYFKNLEDFSTQSIEKQRSAIRWAIEKVVIKTNAVDVTSTFSAFVGSLGCGGSQHILPEILFYYIKKSIDNISNKEYNKGAEVIEYV